MPVTRGMATAAAPAAFWYRAEVVRNCREIWIGRAEGPDTADESAADRSATRRVAMLVAMVGGYLVVGFALTEIAYWYCVHVGAPLPPRSVRNVGTALVEVGAAIVVVLNLVRLVLLLRSTRHGATTISVDLLVPSTRQRLRTAIGRSEPIPEPWQPIADEVARRSRVWLWLPGLLVGAVLIGIGTAVGAGAGWWWWAPSVWSAAGFLVLTVFAIVRGLPGLRHWIGRPGHRR